MLGAVIFSDDQLIVQGIVLGITKIAAKPIGWESRGLY